MTDLPSHSGLYVNLMYAHTYVYAYAYVYMWCCVRLHLLSSPRSTSSSAVLEEVSSPDAQDTTTTTASAPVDSPDSQMVTIHVCDDAKNGK